VAGILSLEDAARVVAARGRALVGLAGSGAMASVRLPEQEAEELAGRWPGVAVAAVNGPCSVVVSGPPGQVAGLVAGCEADGIRVRVLAVDYASHSAQVESVRQELMAGLAGISPRPGTVPFWSGLTGQAMDGTSLDASYWYDSLRGQVRFDLVIAALAGAGFTTFVEASPHPVLTVPVQEVLDQDGTSALVTGTLRRDNGGPAQLLAAVAAVFTTGTPVSWPVLWPATRRAELPGYAFQRQRYWLPPAVGTGNVSDAGLDDAGGHPLLGAVVELPGGQGLVITGRISATTHPWLTEHVVSGTAVLPGMAFAELAWHAGTMAGCAEVEELTVLAPLAVPASGGVQLRVMVGAAGADGRRQVTVSARAEGAAGEWARHASGTLASGTGSAIAQGPDEPEAWPPPGAVPAETGDPYDRLAAAGYEYGPAFRGLRAAWRRGEETFAEIMLPEHVSGAGFAMHPALLDAAMHGAGLDGPAEPAGAGQVLVPFAWSGVVLSAGVTGRLRVRLVPAGPDALSVTITDESERLAGRIGSVRFRPVSTAQLAGSGSGGRKLLEVEWAPVSIGELTSGDWVVAGPDPLGVAGALANRCTGTCQDLRELIAAADRGAPVPAVVAVSVAAGPGSDVPGAVHAACQDMLVILQQWLGWDRSARSTLIVITRGAVAAVPGDDAGDLVGAAVWGLVRTAQSEEPGRFVLADIDYASASAAALPAAAATGEPQLAIRDGRLLAARLTWVDNAGVLPVPDAPAPWRLVATGTGTVEGLALASCETAAEPLGPGQVRVAVRAGGLNFRDVLNALGMYQGQGTLIGNDGAGVVVETSPGVAGLVPGDRV
ncbi:MAG TPA: acyltransferase domain-containing protein, partial [Streptosporangiaceae bacterium]|nr:acyltransferase domain-containing protein [Streptosporangiaceae bacterium]